MKNHVIFTERVRTLFGTGELGYDPKTGLWRYRGKYIRDASTETETAFDWFSPGRSLHPHHCYGFCACLDDIDAWWKFFDGKSFEIGSEADF